MMFIMRGTSCSGKSTFVEFHFDKSTIFSSDNFREMMCGTKESRQFNKQVFDMIYQILDFRLCNKPKYTLYDATNLRVRDASTVIELCKKHKVNMIVLSIEPPSVEELCLRNLERNSKTGFFVPEYVLKAHYDRYFNCRDSWLAEAKKQYVYEADRNQPRQ